VKRKFYEEPSIEILRAENEIWFFNEISPGEGEGGTSGEGSGDFDPWN